MNYPKLKKTNNMNKILFNINYNNNTLYILKIRKIFNI